MKLHRAAAIAAAAATGWAITASAQDSTEPEKRFMPVELQFPSGSSGNLTLIMKNLPG